MNTRHHPPDTRGGPPSGEAGGQSGHRPARGRALSLLARQPMVLPKTAWVRVRRRAPIVAGWRARLVGPGRFELGGRLYVGVRVTRLSRQDTIIDLREGARLVTDGEVRIFPATRIFVDADAEIMIGAGTYINPETLVFCRRRVEIGHDCAIGWQVQILDWDHHALEGRDEPEPVRIGDHVWVGSRATILKGVTVGDGAVIGAGSIVTSDVPPSSLVAGNPARVIRDGVHWR